MITKAVVGGVIAIVAGYGLVEALPLIAGPSLAIASPANYEATTSPVTVAGIVRRATALTVDGGPLLPDQSGRFSATFAFPRGSSILTFVASDRFGRTIIKTRMIVVN